MNNIALLGRLTRDPELTTTPAGVARCKFCLAVRRNFKNELGEYESDFFVCVAWRNTADFVSQYFAKGQMMGISGSIHIKKWEKDGKTESMPEVTAEKVSFVEGKKRTEQGTQSQSEQPATNDGFIPLSDDDTLPF